MKNCSYVYKISIFFDSCKYRMNYNYRSIFHVTCDLPCVFQSSVISQGILKGEPDLSMTTV